MFIFFIEKKKQTKIHIPLCHILCLIRLKCGYASKQYYCNMIAGLHFYILKIVFRMINCLRELSVTITQKLVY